MKYYFNENKEVLKKKNKKEKRHQVPLSEYEQLVESVWHKCTDQTIGKKLEVVGRVVKMIFYLTFDRSRKVSHIQNKVRMGKIFYFLSNENVLKEKLIKLFTKDDLSI